MWACSDEARDNMSDNMSKQEEIYHTNSCCKMLQNQGNDVYK